MSVALLRCSSTTAGGAGGAGGAGSETSSWTFDYCEGACSGGKSCRATPCWVSGCGECACGDPGCICDPGGCECEGTPNGGVCLASDYPTACTSLTAASDCAGDARCRWITPGCGSTGAPGCQPKEECGNDWCGEGMTCTGIHLEDCTTVHACLPSAAP